MFFQLLLLHLLHNHHCLSAISLLDLTSAYVLVPMPRCTNFHVIHYSEWDNGLSSDLNTFPLSDMIFFDFGQPLLAINFLILFVKFLLLFSSTKSRIIDFDVAHVNITIHAYAYYHCYFHNKYVLRTMVPNNLLCKLEMVL